MPSSVKSLVSSIKGNSPGKTEKKNSLIPLIVPAVYLFGFVIIIIIITKIKQVKMVSWNVSLKYFFLKLFASISFFVVLIPKYMLKYHWIEKEKKIYDW